MNPHSLAICNLLFVLFWVQKILCCYLPYQVGKSYGICEYLSPSLVRRADWGAADPTGPLDCFWDPVDLIILHHTATKPCTTTDECKKAVKDIQEAHMKDKMWMDIGYHFLIGGDGKVYEGRPWYKVGAHTKYHNKFSLGIALIGNFDKECPDPVMLDLIPKIIFCGVEKGYVDPDFYLIGHRDAYCTTCPGDAFYKVIKKWPRFPRIVPIPTYTCDANETTTEMPTTTAAPTTTPAPTTTTPKPTTTTPEPTTTTSKPTIAKPEVTTEKDKYFVVVVPKPKFPWYLPWQTAEEWW